VTLVFTVVTALLCLAGAFTVARLLLGPDTVDRIAALDVLVIIIVAAAAVYVAIYRDGSNIPLLAAVALLGFVGSATAIRLTARRKGLR
jgi:multicomponent Na+:H+ antiporter subunit F